MPRLIEAVQSAGQIVTWVCDPMHGNTESVAGYKTRRYERIRQEVCLHVWRCVPVYLSPGILWCMHAYSTTGYCIMICSDRFSCLHMDCPQHKDICTPFVSMLLNCAAPSNSSEPCFFA